MSLGRPHPKDIDDVSTTDGEGVGDSDDSSSSNDDGPEATYREYYSGTGRLTKAVGRKGLPTREYEAYSWGKCDPSKDLSDDTVIDQEIDDARKGLIRGAHFGLVCSSWSRLNTLWNGGTRTCENPHGDGTLEREIRGNKQLAAAWRLMCVFLELGIHFP